MPRITAFFESAADTPLTSPVDAPEIQIRRLDTQAIVQAFTAMTEVGDGLYEFDFAESPTLEYSFTCDGDPNVTSQVVAGGRFKTGSFSGVTEARIETDIPDILADTAAMEPLVSANLDATVSSRNSVVPLAAATDQAEHDATQAAIAALNDIDIADVQTAMDNQGYTSARALLLDNLDASISSVVSAIGALNDLSQADVQSAMTTQGYTSARAVLLDNLDATISSVLTAISGLNDPTVAAIVAGVWDELRSAHTTAGSLGNAMTILLNSMASRGLIDISTDPWQEIRYVFDEGSSSDTTQYEVYELYDQDGTNIAGNEIAGNNPLADGAVMISERRRV